MADREEIRELVREALSRALNEKATASPGPTSYSAPWTGVEYPSHPSSSLFNIGEASIPANDLIEFIESGLCTIEKNKPCDQCGMCRSLGF